MIWFLDHPFQHRSLPPKVDPFWALLPLPQVLRDLPDITLILDCHCPCVEIERNLPERTRKGQLLVELYVGGLLNMLTFSRKSQPAQSFQ